MLFYLGFTYILGKQNISASFLFLCSNQKFFAHIVTLSLSLALLGGAAVGLGNTGSVGVGQQTTPNINTTNQIDPSSIERAYAALGLTYQGNQMQTQPQAQVKTQQQGQSPQGLRPMNPASKLKYLVSFLGTYY